ncbi:MAG: oligosaccharide flippase family protein [Oscillospiraceae bacterium]|nr:oligosaccharide flippase family protein [Oscillospiraceae bacterium]
MPVFSHISKNSVFRSLVAISVSNTLLQLLGFAYRIMLGRMTGAEGLGVYQLIMPLYSVLLSLTLTGLTVAVSKLSAICSKRRDGRGAVLCALRARRIFFFQFFIVALCVVCFSGFISRSVLGDIRTRRSLIPLLVCLFLTGIENITKNFFYGVGKVVPQIVSELSEQLIRAFAVLSLLFFFVPTEPSASSFLIVCGMVISEVFSVIILSFFFRREKSVGSTTSPKPPKTAKIFSVALPISLAATANNLLSSLNTVLIPASLRAGGMTTRAATEAFGVMFGMTLPLLSFPIAFISSLTSVMVPRISETLAEENLSDMRRKAGKTIHATSLIAMPAMALLCQLGTPLSALLFKHPDAGAFIAPLALATLFSYYETTLGSLLNGIGAERQAAVIIALVGVLQILFTLGVSRFGLSAFVAGSVVSSFVGFVLKLLCLMKRTSLSLRFSNWFLRPLIASAICFFISGIIMRASASLLLSATAGLFSYYLALSALGTNFFRYMATLIPKDRRSS